MVGIIPGGDIIADELINSDGSVFNDAAQMIFNADYIGFNTRLTNSSSPNLDKVFFSTFRADDAFVNFGFVYDPTLDLYSLPNINVNEFVIIEATSLSAVWNFNNCRTIEISQGKWLLFCTTGTDAVQRAQIHKSLWFGTDGTDQLILDFTTVTSVKTSNTNDVGKQGHYASYDVTRPTGSNFVDDTTGVFANTTTNTNCSSWSKVKVVGNTTTTSDELGIDLTADEVNNPANSRLRSSTISGVSGTARWFIPSGTERNTTTAGTSTENKTMTIDAIILCEGDIAWTQTGAGTFNDIDFFTDNSIPIMTASGTLFVEGADVSSLTFKDISPVTVTNAIPVINSQIDATSSEQLSISFNGAAFTDVNNIELSRATPTGTDLQRKIEITRTDLSKEDKVTEQAVKFNW